MGAPCTASAPGGQELPQQEPPTERTLISEERLCDWVANARPGQRVEYYRGYLAYDRMPSTSTLSEPDQRALVAVAKRVMQLASDGRVVPVQMRLAVGEYSYIAAKARHRSARGRGRVGARGGLPCRR
jgi:hypothetical protein